MTIQVKQNDHLLGRHDNLISELMKVDFFAIANVYKNMSKILLASLKVLAIIYVCQKITRETSHQKDFFLVGEGVE